MRNNERYRLTEFAWTETELELPTILILTAFLVRPHYRKAGHGCITSKMIKYSY